MSPTLSVNDNTRIWLHGQVTKAQSNEFGCAQGPGEANVKHGTVSNPEPAGRNWGIQYCLHFLLSQMAHQTALSPLQRKRRKGPMKSG
ncbi:hypothetical protein LMG24235_08689 [Paraburkholderia sabiae]|nr:hypothetical protein LMG24235_08689 [Paraburkholderia sabiae]